MNTYNIPRNVKGEGRILYVFSTKALIYTFVGLCVGLVFNFIFKLIGLSTVGIILLVVCGVLGFVIATFKVPDTTAFEITRKTGGENIDDVIRRAIKFKMEHNKIYLYALDSKENNKKETNENGGKTNG